MPHQQEIVIFEVAQAAVNQLGASRGSMLRQIIFLAKYYVQAAPSSIPGDSDTINAATYDQDIGKFRQFRMFVSHLRTLTVEHRCEDNNISCVKCIRAIRGDVLYLIGAILRWAFDISGL